MIICDRCGKDEDGAKVGIWIELNSDGAHMELSHAFYAANKRDKRFCSLRCLKNYVNSIPEELFKKP